VLPPNASPRSGLMAEQPVTADLLELAREWTEALSRRDFDASMSFYALDAVFEGKVTGDRCEGRAAIRRFLEGFVDTFEEYEVESTEIFDLGNGVLFVIVVQKARPAGSTSHVQMRNGNVVEFAEGLITRHTADTDIDEARAAAERLAQERADA
jgi:ketosteroid isomerase-like protein